jgi:predicted RNA binding protein YcfA (HicA-like mRNA interferase family)
VKVRDVIKCVEADGWYYVRTRGDHRQYKHPTKKNVVTIPGQLGDEMPTGTLSNIFRQAEIKRKR